MNIAIRSDKGCVRETNQDALYASRSSVGVLPNLFIVADGMGGAKAGEIASSSAVYSFLQAVRGEEEPSVDLFEGSGPVSADVTGLILEKAAVRANRDVWEMSVSDSRYEGMGTTLAVCSVLKDRIAAISVGDSRIYTINKDEIVQITEDHTVTAELLRRGKISADDAEFHRGKHILTRAIGTEEGVTIQHYDVCLDNINKIILCSDGLYDNMDGGDIFRVISEQGSDIEKAADALLALALERGGRDNISFIIIDIDKEAENA